MSEILVPDNAVDVSPRIRITQRGVEAQPDSIPSLRDDYNTTGIAWLPGFLSPQVCRPLLDQLARARFNIRHEVSPKGTVFGTTLFIDRDEPALLMLQFMVNRPELFALVEQVTGCPPLGIFLGRLHRTTSESAQHIGWHHDGVDFREVGLNICLGTDDYAGGLFEIRNPSGQTVASIKHSVPGDAFLFRIGNGWDHRLTAVESGVRTVGVGWFRTQPVWTSIALPGFRAGTIALDTEP